MRFQRKFDKYKNVGGRVYVRFSFSILLVLSIRRTKTKGNPCISFQFILPKTHKRYVVQVNIGCDLHVQQPMHDTCGAY